LPTLGVLTGDINALAEAAKVLADTEAAIEHARALVEFRAATAAPVWKPCPRARAG
jgi:hypothetical protein